MSHHAPRRAALLLFALVAGLGAGTAPAAAQFIDDYGGAHYPYDYRYSYPHERRYMPPAPIPPQALRRIAARDYGLVRVDRVLPARGAYVIDGVAADGTRTRVIVDARNGALRDRIVLGRPGTRRAPHVARVEPQPPRATAPGPRLVPQPPERPAEAAAPPDAAPPRPEPAPTPLAPVEHVP